MVELATLASKIRSKNAGPFWATIDIFCGDIETFSTVCRGLNSDQVAKVFQVRPADVKRFEIASLNVVKISFPRKTVQGHIHDRDMHGAQFAVLMGQICISY